MISFHLTRLQLWLRIPSTVVQVFSRSGGIGRRKGLKKPCDGFGKFFSFNAIACRGRSYLNCRLVPIWTDLDDFGQTIDTFWTPNQWSLLKD